MPAPPLKLVATKNVGGKDGFQVKIFANLQAQKKNLARFSRVGVRRAEFRALNKTLGKTNTLLKRDISKSYNLAQKEFKGGLTTIKANQQRLTAAIQGTGKRIPIIKVKGGKKQTPLGVRINTGGGSKVLRGHFLATMASGHTGVFRRKDRARHKKAKSLTTGEATTHGLGITERKFPSIAHMVSNKKRGQRLFFFTQLEYSKQLQAQLNFEASKLGATR